MRGQTTAGSSTLTSPIRLGRWRLECWRALAAVLALMELSPSLVAQPSVRDILMVGTTYDRTRESRVGVDQTVAYQLYVYKAPDRVVVDLPSVSWTINSGPSCPNPAALSARSAMGINPRKHRRIIFDLFEPAYVANAMLVDPSGKQPTFSGTRISSVERSTVRRFKPAQAPT